MQLQLFPLQTLNKIRLRQKKQEAEQTQNKANAETDPVKKTELINEANKQNDEAALLTAQSTTANNIAKQLEIDATNRQKEADLNLQYAKALEEAEKTKNKKQAIAKLEELQKQLEEASKQKNNSNTLLENIKADANNKQKELVSAQKKQEKLDSDIKDLTNEINKLDKQIAETKDKDLVDNLKAQKQEQESDLADLKKEQEVNKNKVASLKEEAEAFKSQADFASSIVGGTNTNDVATNNQTPNNSNNKTIASNNSETKNTLQNNETKANEVTNNINTKGTNEVATNNTETNKTNEVNTNTNNEATTNNTSVNENKTDANLNNTGTNEANTNTNNEAAINNTSVNENKTDANLNNTGTNEVNTNITNEQSTNINNLAVNEANESQNEKQKQINNQNKQADSLSAEARKIRKDAKTLTGTEKQNAINKIGELEKQATVIRYTAAKQQIEQDKNTLQSNDKKIEELLKNLENKENAAKVQQLTEEAAIISKASQELMEESEADPSIDSRIGGLSNADDKQKEAIAKQKEALKLLKESVTGIVATNIANQNEVNNNESKTEVTSINVTVNQNNEAQANNNNKEPDNSDNQQGNKTTNANTEQQNETVNNNATTNNVKATNNETQNNEVNNNIVTNESQNKETTSNQAQNTSDNTNTVASNTITPSNKQTNNLSPQQVTEIKNSTQYKQYAILQKEVSRYNTQAAKEQSQAELYNNKATENLKRAEQLKTDAASLPEGVEKQDKLAQAAKLEQGSATLKIKADSMQELASNTKSFAESKKQEADAYTQTLDKTTYDNILAVSTNSVKEKTNQNETNEVTNQINEATTQENNIANNTNKNNSKNETNNETGNNAPNNETVSNTNKGSTDTQKYLGTKGFEVKQGNAYNKTHTIPINEKLPDGLVFRVQIGAFKNPIPANAFKGLTPVGGETTPQGFIRYQAGMFDKYGNANAVKNDLRKLGYKGAFVVAYLNGKRINLAEALVSLQQKGEPVNTDVNATAGITANSNVPVNNEQTNTAEETRPVQSGNINTVNGLLFTVQIGVYANNVSNIRLGNLKPIFREQMTTGNYRYTAGVYNNFDIAKRDQGKVNSRGIAEGKAFVSAYLNGQKIKTTDAIEKAANDKTIQFPPQQPIIFPGETAVQEPTNNTNPTVENNVPQNNTATIQPFSNGVTEGPAPTADNGVKTDDEGITFKVQIGVFRKQVPQDVADKWLKVKTWPVKYTQVNDLYVYTIGSFTEARFAQKLREQVIALGINDAFITVFKDGKKLSPTASQQYLNR